MNQSFQDDLHEIAQSIMKLSIRYNSELNDDEFIDSLPQLSLVLGALHNIIQAGLLTGVNRELWLILDRSAVDLKTQIAEFYKFRGMHEAKSFDA